MRAELTDLPTNKFYGIDVSHIATIGWVTGQTNLGLHSIVKGSHFGNNPKQVSVQSQVKDEEVLWL